MTEMQDLGKLLPLVRAYHEFETIDSFEAGRRAALQRLLGDHNDWIVLNTTMDTLTQWAATDSKLKRWLLPELRRLESDKRGSVSRKAVKMTARLTS